VFSPNWATYVQFAHNDDDSKSGGGTIDRFRTQRKQFTWQNTWTPNVDHQVVLAYEHLNEEAVSPNYEKERNNDAVVLGYSGKFGPQSLQADVRQDDNSAYGDSTTGRLGWGYEIVKSLRFRTLIGTTYRAPSFNELYYPDYGVPTVQPERGRSFELGLNWSDDGSAAGITVYRNDVHDMIASIPNASCPPGYPFSCAGNIGRARLQGATLSGSQQWGGLHVGANFDFLDAIDQNTGRRLLRRAAHQASLTVDYTVGKWAFGATVLDVGDRPDSDGLGNIVQVGDYQTLDLSARWRFAPQWQLEAKVLNATDREYVPAYNYQALGRQAWIGVRFDNKSF
jgi:vitamin B12 transporter